MLTDWFSRGVSAMVISAAAFAGAARAADLPQPVTLASGWQLQDIAKLNAADSGAAISAPAYTPAGWYKATVPGTVLTSLVNNGVYPEPLWGENNRPDKIPESLCRTSYWYRTSVEVPPAYAGKRVWLTFDGINYMAEVWVSGKKAGEIRGAFARGIFDITDLVTPGAPAAVAVHIFPPPHPGNPPEQTVALGMGPNGGVLARDGPTFVCSMGWDWMPAIRDRNIGLWQKVTLSATGPVIMPDPYVVTDLPLPKTDTADVTLQVTLQNLSDTPQTGVLNGKLGGINFQTPVTVPAKSKRLVKLSPAEIPLFRIANPRLWWPNGFGDPNLYPLHLSFDINGSPSDTRDLNVGIRKITYSVPDSEFLTISVNGVPVFCKGGNWGMDEAMKRIPRARLETQIRLHKEAHYTMIRNWVGQSTGEDFYDLCDRYGLLVWDEFFQPSPSDSGGGEIFDIQLYLDNVREKVLRFRNHPCIALWCGRNEGDPTPAQLARGNAALLAELNPDRLYQPSSTSGRGVRSNGPYSWRVPSAFYNFPSTGPRAEVFKTEIGSVSIPTLEAVLAMMSRRDAEAILNDCWAEHDLCRGNNRGDTYPATLAQRYGAVAGLADFVRKAQLANYEAFRAMYEGRLAKMFNGSTAVITWMSNPAQPSTTWQIYSHDLEPFSSFFAVKKACEPIHIQMNQNDFRVMVINNTAQPLENVKATTRVFNLDGTQKYERTTSLTAKPCAVTEVGPIDWPADVSPVHFILVELRDAAGKLLSDNFYWRGPGQGNSESLSGLQALPLVSLDANVTRRDAAGKCLLDVTLTNPSPNTALLAHLQLRKQSNQQRVLPVFYSDNYLSLLPGAARTLIVEAAAADLADDQPLLTLDGWNVTTTTRTFSTGGPSSTAPNPDALVIPSPSTTRTGP